MLTLKTNAGMRVLKPHATILKARKVGFLFFRMKVVILRMEEIMGSGILQKSRTINTDARVNLKGVTKTERLSTVRSINSSLMKFNVVCTIELSIN
jgi:hypothetical protein